MFANKDNILYRRRRKAPPKKVALCTNKFGLFVHMRQILIQSISKTRSQSRELHIIIRLFIMFFNSVTRTTGVASAGLAEKVSFGI